MWHTRSLYMNLNQGVVSVGERTPRENLYDQLLMFSRYNKPVYEKLITDPDISTSDLIDILMREDVDMRMIFALNNRRDQILLPPSVLETLLYDDEPIVRIAALTNENTSFELFREAVLFGDYTKKLKAEMSSSPNALKSLEVFAALWKCNGIVELLDNLTRHLHTQTSKTALDQSLIDFVNDNILLEKFNGPKKCYAYAYEIATPENLDQLKTSTHNPLLNAIASNVNAWSSTHRYLLAQNSNSYTRGIIAETSTDNILLNEIYQATKGKATRKQLADNINFILLP